MSTLSRHDGRAFGQFRPYSFQPHIAPHAAGSVLARCGRTEVICAVSVQEGVPRWMKEQQVSGGWITAEYSMLPYSTLDRKQRDISKGRLDGRSSEIQRLIGRSLRAVVDLEALGARTLYFDCDVLTADGGTRTTAITGAWLALQLAATKLVSSKLCVKSPVTAQLAAVSVGLVGPDRSPCLDLDYVEDRDAAVDMNTVMTSEGQWIEVQAAGEESSFSRTELNALLECAEKGLQEIFAVQQKALASFAAA